MSRFVKNKIKNIKEYQLHRSWPTTHSSHQKGDVLYIHPEAKDNRRELIQPKTSIPDTLKKHLYEFYDNCSSSLAKIKKLKHINTLDIDKKIYKINVKNDRWKQEYQDIYTHLTSMDDKHFLHATINKYTNGTITHLHMGEDYITYNIISQLGTQKPGKISYEKFYAYYVRMCKITGNNNILRKKTKKEIKIKVEMSNTITSKLKYAKLNKQLGVCQNENNTSEGNYAQGYHDFFVNGAIYVMAIYKGKKLIGRAANKIMYNDSGKQYLFMERIYILDTYSHIRNTIINAIYQELVKEREIITSDHYTVGRDIDNIEQLRDNTTCKIKKLTDGIFRSPKRHMIKGRPASYYKDSEVFTLSDDLGKTCYDIIACNHEQQKALQYNGSNNYGQINFFLIN